MKNTKITVRTESKPYPIYIGNENINIVGNLIKQKLPDVKQICILCDKKIPMVFLKKLKKSLKIYNLKIYRLSVNEKIKNFKIAYKLIEKILNSNFNRSDCIIALGGGVLGDLAAFVANLVKRGLKFVNIPTTLLSQVDASIGGKTAVNSVQGKNLIGTFYQPDFVFIDLSLLNSLPKREIICGYAEILKHSLIANRNFFLWLNKNAKRIINNKDKVLLKKAVITSCKIKSKIIEKDEKEKNLRMILNLGHTFAHGFEATKKFSKKINHGEAVLLGIIIAAQLSYKKKILSHNDLLIIKKHYISLNLPMKIGSYFKKSEINKIVHFMKKDKKNLNNKINLILIKKIGKTTKPNKIIINSKEVQNFLIKNYIS